LADHPLKSANSFCACGFFIYDLCAGSGCFGDVAFVAAKAGTVSAALASSAMITFLIDFSLVRGSDCNRYVHIARRIGATRGRLTCFRSTIAKARQD
jgi:hypothetical protein